MLKKKIMIYDTFSTVLLVVFLAFLTALGPVSFSFFDKIDIRLAMGAWVGTPFLLALTTLLAVKLKKRWGQSVYIADRGIVFEGKFYNHTIPYQKICQIRFGFKNKESVAHDFVAIYHTESTMVEELRLEGGYSFCLETDEVREIMLGLKENNLCKVEEYK